MNIGLAGEFRCVVEKSDGTIVSDTGYQRNLILDSGLDALSSGSTGIDLYCVIGAGNSEPMVSQTRLDSAITAEQGSGSPISNYDGSSKYIISKKSSYRFASLGRDVNISELGLSQRYEGIYNYTSATRALIRDVNGNPTTISLLSDEQLTVYYRIYQVFDLADSVAVIETVKKNGDRRQYNTISRLAYIGNPDFYGNRDNFIGKPFRLILSGDQDDVRTYNGELGEVTGLPKGNQLSKLTTHRLSEYVQGSFRKEIYIDFDFNDSVGNIRTVLIPTTMGMFQVRYGAVDDDSPITKTGSEKMVIPFEFSWGRYEGEL